MASKSSQTSIGPVAPDGILCGPSNPTPVPARRHVTNVMGFAFLTMSIAHEIKQPLAAIALNAGTCLRLLDGDAPNLHALRESVRRTLRDVERCMEMITRLRALVAGERTVCQSVDLNAVAREAASSTEPCLRRHRTIVRMELEDSLPPVAGDPVQLQQVIENLVRNGAESMQAVHAHARELTVRTQADATGRVQLSVQDAGTGLAVCSPERLFDAFYTTKPDGMGMGLAISRSIVQRHGGHLWAVANDGPGATFSFVMPHAAAARLPLSRSEA